jgi:hypothetical protein
MAGEVLTGGLSNTTPQRFTFQYGQSLTSAAVMYVVGCLKLDISISYYLGTSNAAELLIYKRDLGQSSFTLKASYNLSFNVGNVSGVSANWNEFAAWLVILRPIKVLLVQQVVVNSSFVEAYCVFQPVLHTTKDKRLRICNNPQAVSYGLFDPVYTDADIISQAVAAGLAISTSIGVPIQNGQWVFGQN